MTSVGQAVNPGLLWAGSVRARTRSILDTRPAVPAGVLLGAAVVLSIVAVGLHLSNGGSTVLTSWWLSNALLALAITPTGALVVWRRPHHPAGWLLCTAGVCEAVCAAGREYLVHGAIGGTAPGWLWVGWAVDPAYLVAILTLPAMLMLFPDGRPARRGHRRLLGFVAVTAVVVVFSDLFTDDTVQIHGRDVSSPAGSWFPSSVTGPAYAVGTLMLITCLLSCPVVLRSRWRSADARERQQMKWVVWAGSIAAVEIVTEVVPINPVASITGALTTTLLAAAVAIAILRYQLFDIDVVIARTLVFAVLTGLVVGGYLLVVVGLGALFGRQPALGLPLVGTALVAVGFAPLRSRVQTGVDRLVYGDRSNPYGLVTRLGRQLERTGPERDLTIVVQTVAHALKLPHVALVTPDGEVCAQTGEPLGRPLRQPLAYAGEPVGELLLSPRTPNAGFDRRDRQLVADLALQVGAAVHAVSLSASLQRSRQRLVAAKEEERRRLRRDLHDGLGPRLAALGLKLDAVGLLVDRRPDEARCVLTSVGDDIRGTIKDIRRLVAGLRPPALDQLGLIGALRERAAELEAGIGADDGVRFVVTGPDDMTALPAAIEVAAFWIATEAMTNVVRHASAQRCEIRVVAHQQHLVITVCDDGCGLPDGRRAGVGSRSIVERAAELGGSCTMTAAVQPPGGTEVRAILPLPDEGAVP